MISTLLPAFDGVDLLDRLEQAAQEAVDALGFGVISMSVDGMVTHYSAAEARLSGLTAARLVGWHFFTGDGACSNNAMVASQFETDAALDQAFDYVFSFTIAPKNVRFEL